MSDEKEQVPAGSAEAIEESKKLTQNVARFAQYTSPVMLAMLASAGHDMAFAAVSQQT
ncbi:MAG: hypothetical protein WCE79_02205 [Xanthobacteraceae bacterium]